MSKNGRGRTNAVFCTRHVSFFLLSFLSVGLKVSRAALTSDSPCSRGMGIKGHREGE